VLLRLPKEAERTKTILDYICFDFLTFFPTQNAGFSIKYNYSMKQANRNYGAAGKRNLQVVLLMSNKPIKHRRLYTNCLHNRTCKITHLNVFSFVQSAVITTVFVTRFLKHKILHSAKSVYLCSSHPGHNRNYYPKQY